MSQMTPEHEARVKWMLRSRLSHLFQAAWHSIAVERGWRYDVFLSTCSHGTLALRSYFHLKGV